MADDHDRSQTTSSKASHPFERKFAVSGNPSYFDIEFSLEMIEDLFGPFYIAGGSQAQSNDMLAPWDDGEKGIE
jgi:hypothetical protein